MAYTLERFGPLPIMNLNGVQIPRGGGNKPPAMDLSNGGAYDPYGTEQIRPGARLVSATGFIFGSATGRQAVLDAWYAAGGARNKLWARSSSDLVTNTVQWVWARLHPPRPEGHYQRPTHDELSLEWTIYSPFWHGLRHGNGLVLHPSDCDGFD